jgi:hypothetical protein
VSAGEATKWFLELGEHPERYVLDTHAGFEFTQGAFGQSGARFVTWERFYGLKLTLHFELLEVGDRSFRFRLVRPPLPVYGAYEIEETEEGTVYLVLWIEGTTSLGTWFLRCPLVRKAIERQIRNEVEHVKTSMESLYAADQV